ncbi:hypothetical protein D3C80_2159840 [compost metagenome]
MGIEVVVANLRCVLVAVHQHPATVRLRDECDRKAMRDGGLGFEFDADLLPGL